MLLDTEEKQKNFLKEVKEVTDEIEKTFNKVTKFKKKYKKVSI